MSSIIPVLKSREIISALVKIGFTFYRQKGSHKIYVMEDKQVVVPDHSKDLKKGTTINIIKGSGLSIEEFKKYL
jgi:predicted RNA binding protein YcfA (HicA-like mRNA interferase family)